MDVIFFFIFALISEIIGAMAGFGSSTILLPIALFFFDFKISLILVAIFHISGNVGRITFFRHGLNKKMLLTFGIPSIILTVIGALLVSYISQNILKLILGVFLLAYAIISIFKSDLTFKPKSRNAIIGGSVSGFFAGLIGTGGALRSAFLTSFNLNKNVYIATAAAIALAVDLTRIQIYFENGFLPVQLYYFIPILFITALFGSYIGKRIVNKIPKKVFRKIILVLIGLAGLKFIYDGLVPLL